MDAKRISELRDEDIPLTIVDGISVVVIPEIDLLELLDLAEDGLRLRSLMNDHTVLDALQKALRDEP